MAKTPGKKRGSNVPADEKITDEMTPEQKKAARGRKFSRLASARVSKAVKAITNIGNLATPAYVFNADQVKAIDKYIKDARDAVMVRYNARLEGKTAASNEAAITI